MILIADTKLTLKKSPGKGGWTYLEIPAGGQKKRKGGWMAAKGTIDGVELNELKVWPTRNGNLFLPVKAGLRREIGKEEGDEVQVKVYIDEQPTWSPGELLDCLADEPLALERFNALDKATRHACLNWIAASANGNERVERMAEAINRLIRKAKPRFP